MVAKRKVAIARLRSHAADWIPMSALRAFCPILLVLGLAALLQPLQGFAREGSDAPKTRPGRGACSGPGTPPTQGGHIGPLLQASSLFSEQRGFKTLFDGFSRSIRFSIPLR